MKRKIGSLWSMRYGREGQTKNKQHIRRQKNQKIKRTSATAVALKKYFVNMFL